MFFFKFIIYVLIIGTSTGLGMVLSQKYISRVNELKDLKSALVLLKTKIRYTYAPLKDIFLDTAKSLKGNIANLFQNACSNIEYFGATECFCKAIDETTLNLTAEDKNILKNFSKMLGKTDLEGQVNEIELTQNFIDTQIEKAVEEKEKNAKLYKTLGVICGVGIVIILL